MALVHNERMPESRFDISRPSGPRLEEYAERFLDGYRDGKDLYGEARFVDALAERGSRILDGGCGTGRVGGALTSAGHRVVAVDRSARLLEIAAEQFPQTSFVQCDLLDVTPSGLAEYDADPLDIAVLAGNVLPCLAEGTEQSVLERLASLLRHGGRLVIGFHTDREYSVADLDRGAPQVGLRELHRFSDWQLSEWYDDSPWITSVLIKESTAADD